MVDEFAVVEGTQVADIGHSSWTLRRADIAFVIDCTDSMEVVHQAVIEAIEDVVEEYRKASVTVRLGLTEFRDKTWVKDKEKGLELMKVHRFGDSSFTQNIDDFKIALSGLKSEGGGSPKESCFDAIATTVLEADWDENSDSIIVFFSEAKPIRRDELVKEIHDLCTIVEDGGINQLHLCIDKKDPEVLEEYDHIFFCASDPKDESLYIFGDTYPIYSKGPDPRRSKNDDHRSPNLSDLKKILKMVARSSGKQVRSSSGNIYGVSPSRRTKTKKSSSMREKSSTSSNKYS